MEAANVDNRFSNVAKILWQRDYIDMENKKKAIGKACNVMKDTTCYLMLHVFCDKASGVMSREKAVHQGREAGARQTGARKAGARKAGGIAGM